MTRSISYRRRDQVAFRRVGEECLLIPVRTDPSQEVAVFRLNEVGALLWELLETPSTTRELSREVVDRFEVDPRQAEEDVAQFVGLLASKQLIEPAER